MKQQTNEYYVKWRQRVIDDIMAITKISQENANKLINLLHKNDSRLTLEGAMQECGVDITDEKVVIEFANYWEYADDDRE